jgi:hypothetical protein
MKQIILVMVLSVFIFTGCSGTNPYLNNKNVMGGVGGIGGGVLGNTLCKNCKSSTKLISTIGGVLGGLWLGSTTGEFFDRKDRERQVKLIEDTLEKNKDFQTSTETYKKSNWVNPNTGQQENVVVQNQVTPMRTYQQPQYQPHYQTQYQPPNLSRQKNWEQNYKTQHNQWNTGQNYQTQSGGFCREYTVDVKISKELTGSIQDHKTQYFHSCRSQSGWRTIQ